jgi:hypothetical protein
MHHGLRVLETRVAKPVVEPKCFAAHSFSALPRGL